MEKFRRPLILCAACLPAVGWFLLFPTVDWGGLAWVFLVPGLWCAALEPGWRPWLWIQGLAGLAAASASWVWLRHAGPMAFLGVPILGAYFALTWVAWWALARGMISGLTRGSLRQRFLVVMGLAAGWVLLEWIRSWLLTGFPWLPLAASQWETPLVLQPIAWIGQWGMSGVIVLFNVALFSWSWRLVHHARDGWKRMAPEFYAALLILVVSLVTGLRAMTRQEREPWLRVAVVQPDIPQSQKWDPASAGAILDTLELVHRAAAAMGPDLVLWPEAVMPDALSLDPRLREWLARLAREGGAPILLGTLHAEGYESLEWTNAAMVARSDGQLSGEPYAKRKRVPFGEYVPWESVLGRLNAIAGFGSGIEAGTNAAPLQVPLADGRLVSAGVLICYEDVFPWLARDSVREGAEVLVVLANNGWFGREAFAEQHAAHSVLRAIETRRPVLRCGNAGWSGWIDEYGRQRAVVREATTGDTHFRGAGSFDVVRDPAWVGKLTPAVVRGHFVPAIAAALLLVAILGSRRTPPQPVPPASEPAE